MTRHSGEETASRRSQPDLRGTAEYRSAEVALKWRKSTHSGTQGGACVEVAACPSVVHVRDSKDPDGPALTFGAEQWSAFVRFAVQQG
ncbi:DUF397 domain-containing protein [Streptomyces sp. PTM05]|uniref:DUF397 domain-containing protein n=1 Tax=Streptantibioticus parmotrematis TaxID=2873249 RepID=A0ABS7QX38_9ACTN|nr:DUF397 domain-containing protein [Streptantibioticus parmotrematis]